MLNQAIVVGTVCENHNEDHILIDCKRNYKNLVGEYESDIIKIVFPRIDLHMKRHIQIGHTVAVKGSLRAYGLSNSLEFIAEKISYL